MRAQGPGEWWRRCWWWTDVHLDGDENGWSILLHQCGRCGAKERIMADACSKIAEKRAEWGRANPEDVKYWFDCCSYCGGDITEPGTTLCIGEESLDYSRGVWWMTDHGHDKWRRCYEMYETAADHDGERMVKLTRCHRCSEEERVIIDTHCTCASDCDSDDWGQGSMAL